MTVGELIDLLEDYKDECEVNVYVESIDGDFSRDIIRIEDTGRQISLVVDKEPF